MNNLINHACDIFDSDKRYEILDFYEKLVMPITILELQNRSVNCLLKEDIILVGQLIQLTEYDLLAIPNFARVSLEDVLSALKSKNLHLETLIFDWNYIIENLPLVYNKFKIIVKKRDIIFPEKEYIFDYFFIDKLNSETQDKKSMDEFIEKVKIGEELIKSSIYTLRGEKNKYRNFLSILKKYLIEDKNIDIKKNQWYTYTTHLKFNDDDSCSVTGEYLSRNGIEEVISGVD